MVPLPFSKLPAISFQLIFENVDLIDILNFSFISKKCDSLVKNNIRLASATVEFRFDSNNHFITIRRPNLEVVVISIRNFESDEHFQEFLLNGGNLNLTPFFNFGVNICISANGPSNWLNFYADEKAKLLEVSRQLSDITLLIFPTQKLDLLTFDYPKYDLFRFVRFHARNFNKLHICNRTEEFFDEDLRILLENLQVDDFYLSVKSKNIKYRGDLRYRRVHLSEATWLTMECLLRTTTQHLLIYNSKFTGQEVNSIIKNWISGGLENLEKCVIGMDLGHELNTEEVLEGIDSTDWHPPQCILPFEETFRLDYCNAKCLKRRDGRNGMLWVEKQRVEFHRY